MSIPPENGKYSIIGMAFDRSAEDGLKTWLQPIFETFIKTESNPGSFDVADVYDVNFFFIPMISGFSKVAEEFKNNSDKVYWPYIIDLGKDQIKQTAKGLEVGDKSVPFFYVVDPKGRILKRISGRFAPNKLEEMEDLLD